MSSRYHHSFIHAASEAQGSSGLRLRTPALFLVGTSTLFVVSLLARHEPFTGARVHRSLDPALCLGGTEFDGVEFGMCMVEWLESGGGLVVPADLFLRFDFVRAFLRFVPRQVKAGAVPRAAMLRMEL